MAVEFTSEPAISLSDRRNQHITQHKERTDAQRQWLEILEACSKAKRQLKLSNVDVPSKPCVHSLYPKLLAPLQQIQTFEIVDTCVEDIGKEIVAVVPNIQHLTISFSLLSSVNTAIFSLPLVTLILDHNEISELPSAGILQLTKTLQVLDLSHNLLKDIPAGLCELENLVTLNCSDNKLAELPAKIAVMKRISTLVLSYNSLETLPDFGTLQSLRVIHLDHNKLKNLPIQIIGCEKRLSECKLDSNPFSDKKFVKLASDQKSNLKAMFTYLKKFDSRPVVKPTKIVKMPILKLITPRDNSEIISAGVSDTARTVRPFLLITKVTQLTFTPTSFDRFIDMQTDIHMHLCNKRQVAAIGTHDMDLVLEPFTLDALPPEQIKFVPLFQQEEVNGLELIQKFEKDQNSTMLKYLKIISDKPTWPVLLDAYVMSLPPVINSEYSKISVHTKSMLIEVSSHISLEICKEVMCSVLYQLAQEMCGDGGQQQLLVFTSQVANREFSCKFPLPKDIDRMLGL